MRLARQALGERTSGSSAAPCATRALGRPVTDLDLAVAGEPEPVAREIASGAKAAAFPLSEQFATWRVAARDGAWQIDVTALRGETIEADLGGATSRSTRWRCRSPAAS